MGDIFVLLSGFIARKNMKAMGVIWIGAVLTLIGASFTLVEIGMVEIIGENSFRWVSWGCYLPLVGDILAYLDGIVAIVAKHKPKL